jgi:hypothetical protein
VGCGFFRRCVHYHFAKQKLTDLFFIKRLTAFSAKKEKINLGLSSAYNTQHLNGLFATIFFYPQRLGKKKGFTLLSRSSSPTNHFSSFIMQ